MKHLTICHAAQGSFTSNPQIESGVRTVSGVVVEDTERQHIGYDAVGVGGSSGLLRGLNTIVVGGLGIDQG